MINKYSIPVILTVLSFLTLPSKSATGEELFSWTQKGYKNALVKRVITTDTIMLESGEKVKLIGLRSPDLPEREKRPERDQFGFIIEEEISPLVTIEEKAIAFAKELLEGKEVRLEFDKQKKGDNHKTLAYVYVGDVFANTEIIRHGFAYLQIRPPNLKHVDLLRKAYREAKEEKRGLQNE